MKKTISVLLTFILLMMCVAIPASANEVTSSTTGFTNIHFSNGYIGFCIDRQKSGSISGDTFTPADSTSVANNNIDNSDISQQLKVMFTQCFDKLFTSDGNGSYHITSETADSVLEFAIYHFTGEQSYIWGEIKNVVNAVKAYSGPEIPDDGYSLTLDNGDTVTFSFMVMEPQKEGQQSFFAYKLNVSQEAPHEHNYGSEWKSDDTNHWHECECKDKTDISTHNGNTADCVTSSVCGTCGKELAGVNKDNHTGETVTKNAKPATEFEDGYTGDIHCKGCGELLTKGEIIPATHEHNYGTDWESDDTNHWHECECEDKADIGTHDGNTADCVTSSVCGTCGKELAGVNKDNHTGETVTKNAKPATEFEDGYTGDIHCKGCGELLTKGEIIPATHEHNYGTDWKSDDNEHWHECECEDKTDIGTHDGNTADCVTSSVCGTCGKELAGVDKDNHTGETETRNEKPATEFEDGYTGDIHCKGCGELLTKGEIIPATHEHSYGTDWESDDTNHWHECECKDKTDIGEHTYTDGICSICGKELSTDDPNGDDDTTDSNTEDIIDTIIGLLGDMDLNIDAGKIEEALEEALAGLDINVDIDEITEYLSSLDSDADIDKIITDLIDIITGSDDKNNTKPEGAPETETDTDGETNGDDDTTDNNTEDIIDTIIGLLGDMDLNIDAGKIEEALEEALAGLDINVDIDEIIDYLANLDSDADIDKIIADLIDIITGSDDKNNTKPEGAPETDTDKDGETNGNNTNTDSDTISPDTGFNNGVSVAIIILSLSIIAAFAVIICKKKYASVN